MDTERREVLDSYNGATPKPLGKGRTKYVSLDVYDAVESASAQLIETFCGSFQPVRFMAVGPDDVEPARQATQVVNYVVESQNDGFTMKQDVIKDGLQARIGVVKVWWEKSESESEETFEGGSEDELAAWMASNPLSDPTEVNLNPDGSLSSAKFKTKTNTSRVRIETVPPEEFGVTSGTRRLPEADLVFHRTSKTRAELRSMGFEKKVVDELQVGTGWINDFDLSYRTSEADTDPFVSDGADERSGEKIEVFECFTKLALDGGSASTRTLWRVLIAGSKVLEKEPVKRIPFHIFGALHQSHTIWGPNFAKNVVSTQNARTALTRSVIDHAVHTTNPRYTVLRGGLPRPDELMDPKYGGIVNINREAAVQPLPQSGLNPFVFQTRQILEEDQERTTGISRLSQGLNKDALSKQNSGKTLEDQVSLSQVRQKVMARRFAVFLSKVYLEVYQLLMENGATEMPVEVAGNWTTVNPSTWKVREHMWIDFALGSGEKRAESAKYVEVDKYLSSDPRFGEAYGPKQRYTVVTRALEGMGISDVGSVLQPLQPHQPTPAEQVALAKAQSEVAELQARAASMTAKTKLAEEAAQFEHKITMMELEIKRIRVLGDLKAAEAALAHKVNVDTAEIRMAHTAQVSGDAKAIIAPGGR